MTDFPPLRCQLRFSKGTGLVLALLGLSFGAGSIAFHRSQGLREREFQLADPFRSRVIEVRGDPARETGLSVVLLHGWRCSASILLPMARMLARNGATAYVVDLPGHGQSPVGLPVSNPHGWVFFPKAEVSIPLLEALIREEKLQLKPLVLIGHSWGGTLISDLSHRSWASQAHLIARIILEGPDPSPVRGQNSLYVFDPRNSAQFEALAAAPKRGGTFSDGTAYEFFQPLRQIPHASLVRSEEINAKVLDWIRSAGGATSGNDARPYVLVPMLLSACLLAMLVLALLALKIDGLPKPPRSPDRRAIGIALAAGAIAARLGMAQLAERSQALYFLRVTGMLGFLHVIVAGWLGLVILLVAGKLKGLRAWLDPRAPLIGGLAFLLVYATFGSYVDSQFFHAVMSWNRIPRFALVAAGIFPASFLVRAAASGSLAGLLIWLPLTLCWSWLEAPGGPPETAVFVLLAAESLACVLESSARSRIAACTLFSLVVAWAAAAFYPLLQLTQG